MPALRLVPDGPGGPALYAHGLLVRGVRMAIADGGHVLLVVDPAAITIDRASRPVADQDNGATLIPLGTRLPTDGQA